MFTSSHMDTIGKSAIEGCSQLTHISLKGITSINERTFAGTAIAGELTIPSAIQYIKDEAFMDCKNITKVTVTYNSKETRNNLRDIRTKAFFGCTSLTEVDVKRLTVTMGYAAFGGCPSLKVIKIPFVGVKATVNKNGAAGTFGYIFGGADVIDTTKLDGLTTVKQFYDEQKTTEVVYYIPSSIKRVVLYGGTGASVWSGMFSNCTMIESIDVQSGNIMPNAFYGCSNLKTLNVQYSGKYDSSTIKIYPHAFDGLYYLKELYISGVMKDAFGSSVMAIDDLLKDCTSLEKLEIPIGGAQEFYKFFDSSASNGFVVPQSLKSVTVRDSDDGGLISFQNCIHITDITIGEGITRVQALRYFMGCTSLKNLVISNSVTIIKRGALYGCSALENLTIPFVGSNTEADIANDNHYCEFFGEIFGVNEYEGSYRVSQPPEIDRPVDYFIPQTLTTVTVTGGEIYYHAFYGYESITSIGLSNVILNSNVFAYMYNLENLYLYGSNIQTIGKTAFTESSYPNKIHVDSLENWFLLPRTLTYFIRNGHLYVGEELLRGEVVIPGTVTSIYKDQFRNMVDITSIVFENGIVSIDEWAFYGCANITSITLPETLETIGENAFAKCTSLVSVTCPAIIVERGLLPATVKYLTITSGEVKNLNNLPELVSLTLEDGVTVIGADVCTSNCDNLKTITIGKGLTTWTQGAFSSCTKLETITVSADNPNFKSENNVLYSKDGKTEYLSAQEQPTT